MGERLGTTPTGTAFRGLGERGPGAAAAAPTESPPVRTTGATASAGAQGTGCVHAWAKGYGPALANAMDLGGEATAASMAVETRRVLGRHLEAAYRSQGQAAPEVISRRTSAQAAMPTGTPGTAEGERIREEHVEDRSSRTKPDGGASTRSCNPLTGSGRIPNGGRRAANSSGGAEPIAANNAGKG